LDNFAPSLAGGPRWITGGGEHSYIGINGMVTVYRIAADEADQSRPFSLGVGGLLDFGGWVQTGVNYQFKDQNAYLVFGIRPEIWKF
jgi:hypothetical protein